MIATQNLTICFMHKMKKLNETTTAATGTGDYVPLLPLQKRRKLRLCKGCNGVVLDRCPICDKKEDI